MVKPGGDLPTAIFLSVHKGASTFLAAELAPAICRALPGVRHERIGWSHLRGVALDEMALPPTGVLATRVYPDLFDKLIERPVPAAGRFADKRLVLVRRDPRDAAVSLYYSRAYSHRAPPGREDRFFAERERLQQMAPADGILELTARQPIEEFRATVDALRRFPGICPAPYELLVGDFDRWFDRVGRHLGLPESVALAIGTALADSVSAPAHEDPLQHKRRVTPGNWREVFDDRLRELFEREIGPQMREAGYEW